MPITLSTSLAQKQSLSLSLKMWLPLLQSSLQDLESHLRNISYENPFLDVKKPKEFSKALMGNSGEFIESLTLSKESFYEKVLKQLTPPLFPTPRSQKVAYEILCDINEQGYFDGDVEQIAIKCSVYKEYVEQIRQRFARLSPAGIGSLDVAESFLFQLDSFDAKMDDELYQFIKRAIKDITHLDKYATHHLFEEAKNIIKHFNNPPAVKFMSDEVQIIPDFYVNVDEDIDIKINSAYYPDIKVKNTFSSKNDDAKVKLKEARDLVNLLDLRKSTLYKIVLIIVEKQLSFFVGGELKPYSMQELASELGFAESTISRAVANKYIECSLGVYPLKHFFTNALNNKDLSSSQIKNYIKSLIDNENKEAPLTDKDIVQMIEKKFNLTLVRRTITKYRKLLEVPSSKERKKLYMIENL